MPRQLPGLYWDDDRQRYFPRRQVQLDLNPQPVSTPAPDFIPIQRRQSTSFRALSDLRSSLPTVQKDALVHQIQSSQISLTDNVIRSTVPLQGLFSAFKTVFHNGRLWKFAGDTHGWFYSSVVDKHHQSTNTTDGWQDQFYLSSEVSSISVSGSACVAASFGPECKVLYLPLDSSIQSIHTTRIDSRIVHDIWSADLQGSRLVLGANKQAVVLDDIAASTSIQRLPTESDVLALAQHESVLYTGLRNGGILRFDTRMEKSHIYPLFNSSQRTSSITSLSHLRDHQLLTSFIDGDITTFDLRFPIRTPLMTFTGNNNSYTVRLPLAIDPYEKFLFAAGQDNKIRVWSLITGGPALDPGRACSTDLPLFQHPPEHRIAALQVVEEKDGMSLWVASGTELGRYSLGNRSGTRI